MLKTLNILRYVITLAVVLVERDGEGERKKEEVKDLVFGFMEEFGINLPIPDEIVEYVLDYVIDLIVEFLNERMWKTS
ncbi:MAG: hypothetical protein DRP38_08025 [Thermotogae bacterium]|nr:hypothetical protein [Thermotogaceae bacterium]OQX56943.1 MAG: hypothetical protein B5M49_04790 [Thermotoga sp. 4484_232]RKX45904.1 MAG: hypothetical protein DRP38_08025 [Thermotogota bacterium]RKX53980.1 MAG: hypothetical protein DRP24_06765 [Thermotoga sp.]HDG62307.1 hypothetical protein [Thermotoga sp.]